METNHLVEIHSLLNIFNISLEKGVLKREVFGNTKIAS